MKRNSVPTIILLIVSYLAFGILVGIVAGWFLHMPAYNVITIILPIFIFMGFPNFTNLVLFPVAKKTMKKGTQANNFGRTTTFISKGGYRIKLQMFLPVASASCTSSLPTA